jgi:uncharacterized protein YaeQ
MALPSTVFKAELQISDMDRHYYATHSLTLARHPSETDERMMMRVVGFAFNASEHLKFANGLTDSEQPDLWCKDFAGNISLWIAVGLLDERQIKRACGRAEQVIVYAYGNVDVWWAGLSVEKFSNLSIFAMPRSTSEKLVSFVERSMKVQCSIDNGILFWSTKDGSVEIELQALKRA